MTRSAARGGNKTPHWGKSTSDLTASSPPQPLGPQALPTESGQVPDEAECPLASPLRDRSGFETFLADLSATFINVPADQVVSQIVAGLRQIVEFLGIDRSGFGELVTKKNKLVITHSYAVTGLPATP